MASIDYPITVDAIEFDKRDTVRGCLFGAGPGEFVSIRPCAEEYGGKTYLGIMLGDIARGQMVTYKESTKTLMVAKTMFNPAIFVPDLKKVIFGAESWWGAIADEKSLREITDDDIDNVWYVRALKALSDDQPKS